MKPDVARLLERYIERRERDGVRLPAEELCRDAPELAGELAEHIRRYDELESTLDFSAPSSAARPPKRTAGDLPSFDGFRTVERLGGGGMGEVYKLEDLKLGRTVAAKVLRRGDPLANTFGDFLREARSLALFQDPGIVRIHEYRDDADPPVIIMEYVEGFELGRIGPSLEIRQRARLVAEICDTVERAHEKGIQHRDLKPGNILVDAALEPKIVDFGLSGGDPRSGHGVGTLGYIAPEQLDPERAIDDRTDVYALGVVLYELLAGEPPFAGADAEVLAAIREGRPRLPMEVEPEVPEPLQAIALKAMECDPERRYAAARDMAADLRRWLDGCPVRARPSLYASALGERVRPHLDELREWLSLKLIYPHEAERLREGYRKLEAREDDWIVESRRLTLSQIALYLGAFLLTLGGFFYLAAHRVHEAIEGIWGPIAVLGLPWAALTTAAFVLERRERKAVAVAFYLAGAAVLPLFLVLFLHELGFWPGTDDDFFEGMVSNRELQLAAFLSCAWALALALRTRTIGLSAAFTVLAAAAALAVHTDLGLETWIDDGRWDLLALHSVPLLAVLAALAVVMDRRGRAWLATPLYLGGAVVFVLIFELLSLDGRAFGHLGISLDRFEPPDVEAPTLLETLAAMTLAGILIYFAGSLLDRYASPRAGAAARLLFVLSPFAVLEPIFYLSSTEQYAPLFHWIYLALALAITLLSRHRQRKSFYFAGLFNTGTALYLVAGRYEWFEVPSWSLGVIAAGLAALAAGLGFDHLERTRRHRPPHLSRNTPLE